MGERVEPEAEEKEVTAIFPDPCEPGDIGKGYLIPRYTNGALRTEGGRKEFISLSYIKGNRCDFLYKRAFH